MNDSRSSSSSAEVGSSAITSAGAPISARAAATRCCCPTDRAVAGRCTQRRAEVELAQQPFGGAALRMVCRTLRRLGALPPPGREAAGQEHVLQHRQIRQQVELLKDVADAIGTTDGRAKPATGCPSLARRNAPSRRWQRARRQRVTATCSCHCRWHRLETPSRRLSSRSWGSIERLAAPAASENAGHRSAAAPGPAAVLMPTSLFGIETQRRFRRLQRAAWPGRHPSPIARRADAAA